MSTIAAIDRRNQLVDALKQLLENLSDTALRALRFPDDAS